MVEFLVTVPGGTGGGYYIDGVQKPIIPVVTNGTFRFNQNDSTNNNHPLILSTTTSTAGIISTGVSYYLDGASNATNYRNTALFNAATVRYIEITVAETSDFYYLCNVHGFSMGNNMDVTFNTWGALGWNVGEWNAQGNETVLPTGNALNININQGWGQLDWNSSDITWGGNSKINVAIGQQINVTGQQLNLTLNSVTEVITVDAFVTGLQLNTSLNEVDTGPDANVTGQQLNLSVGTVQAYNVEGWGRETWGEDVWGAEGFWETVFVTGQQINTSLNSVTPLANANVDLTGQQLNVAEGEVDPSPDATVTGIGMTVGLAIGTVVIGTGNVAVTGQQLNISLGTASGEAITIASVTGLRLNTSVGTVFAGGTSIIEVTGNGLTIALNSINNQIWTEISTGTDATWTEIDTAA
jgi:hypothetical protein